MRKHSKKSGITPIKLALIITGSIVAAAGIIFLVVKFMKKVNQKKLFGTCDCGCDCDCCDDTWEFDDDLLGDLRFDEEECCCEDEADELSSAVDEAIEAIGTDSEE